MRIENVLEKYNLELNWKDKNESVFSNDEILLKLIEEEDYNNFLIEYKESFEKWTDSFYLKKVHVEDKKELQQLDTDIDLIIKKEVEPYEI